jgi:hypothetical protein
MPPASPTVRLRDILVAHYSFDEIVTLLWELGILDSVPHDGITKETLATRAVDAIAHHGRWDNVVDRVRQSRSHLNPAVWRGLEGWDPMSAHDRQPDPDPQALTLSPAATRALVRQLNEMLDLSTVDHRLMLLARLGVDDARIAVEGAAEVFGYRLVRYLTRCRRVADLQALLDTDAKEN